MLRQRSAIAIAVTLGLATLSACGSSSEPVKQRVRILATTDEHSHLLATAPERDEWPLAATAGTGKLKGGVARRATVIDREKADGVPTVLLSNGDFSQGSLSAVAFTKANFDAILMRLLGYDAVALGNHEFDALPAGLAASIAAARSKGGAPPFVLTNAIFSSTSTADDSLAALYGGVGSGKDVVSGLIVDKGGVKVGVVSAVGPSAAFDGQYTAAPVTFSTASLAAYGDAYVKAANISIASILQPVIDQLRAGGAQVVVLLFHGGLRSTGSNGDLDGTGTGATRVDGVVEHLKSVDLVVGGHTHGLPPSAVTYVADADARQVPVMQPAAFGNQIARAEFIVEGGAVTFDGARAAEVAVDDTTLPTSNQEVRAALSSSISSIEALVLPGTLQAVTGTAIADNPVDVGDLYFYALGKTTFDVTGTALPRETNAINLDTDALLAVTKGLGYAAEVALQNAGSIRGDLVVGATGTIGFSDVFRMASLGADPFELSPGYPLVRVYIRAMELRAAFEQTLQLSFLNNDYYLGEQGLAIKWDPVRARCASATACAVGAGWITTFQLMDGATNPVLYDPVAYASTAGWAGTAIPSGPLAGVGSEAVRMVPVVTTYLVASFAGKMGVTLYDGANNVLDITTVAGFNAAAVEWPTTAHVKDHQALARYIRGLCLANTANPGFLPATYNAVVPNRVRMCPGGVCP